MKFEVKFDTELLYKEPYLSAFNSYFKREKKAIDVARELGIKQSEFFACMAGIFSKGNSIIKEVD